MNSANKSGFRRKAFSTGLGAAFLMICTFSISPDADAQRRGASAGGSVRNSSRTTATAGRSATTTRSTATRSTATRSTATRSTATRSTATRSTATRSTATRVGRPAQPAHRPGYGGGGAAHRSHNRYDYRYNNRKDARRDYYRYRTVNNLIRLGAYCATRPKTSTTVVVTGTTYYYSGGVYYTSSGSGYVIVSAPPGAVVYSVPAAAVVVYVGETPYLYYGGAYYVYTTAPAPQPPPPTTVNVNVNVTTTDAAADSTADGIAPPEDPPMVESEENYEVVGPPVGAAVPYVPDEADEQTIDGKKYFIYEGTYYRPFASEDETVYMVVEDPTV